MAFSVQYGINSVPPRGSFNTIERLCDTWFDERSLDVKRVDRAVVRGTRHRTEYSGSASVAKTIF